MSDWNNQGWPPPGHHPMSPGGMPATPPPGMPPGYQPSAAPSVGAVPWESEHGSLLNRWWNTIFAASFKSPSFFTGVAQSEDAVAACTFNMITSGLAGAVLGLTYLLLFLIAGGAMVAGLGGKLAGAWAGLTIGWGLVIWLALTVTMTAIGFIGPWVMGGIHHLVLLVLGAVPAGRSYAHSVRVSAYATGSAMAFMAVPFVGGMVATVLNVKNHVQGYIAVHQCDPIRPMMAFAAPPMCCCCSYIGFLGTLSTIIN